MGRWILTRRLQISSAKWGPSSQGSARLRVYFKIIISVPYMAEMNRYISRAINQHLSSGKLLQHGYGAGQFCHE